MFVQSVYPSNIFLSSKKKGKLSQLKIRLVFCDGGSRGEMQNAPFLLDRKGSVLTLSAFLKRVEIDTRSECSLEKRSEEHRQVFIFRVKAHGVAGD